MYIYMYIYIYIFIIGVNECVMCRSAIMWMKVVKYLTHENKH